MKKLFVIALGLVLMFAIATMAADPASSGKTPMSIGIKGGISLGTLTGDSLKNRNSDADKKSRFGIAGGASFGIGVTKSFTVQAELLYVQKGVKFEAKTGSEKMTLKTDYLEIPVLLKFTPELYDSKIAPTIFAGPFIGFKMSAKEKDEGFADPADNGETDIKDSLKSTDFGITFGGGFGYKLTKGEIFFDVRYDLGLTKIVKAAAFDNGNFDTKTGTFLAFVGYRFDI